MALSVASALGALGAVEDLLAGAAVTIGGVGLTSLEVPASMPFGGDQRIQVHEMVGGGRTVDVMGPTEADAEWSGTFTGPGAVARARAIDAIRIAGNEVTLTWGDFSRQVVVRSFRPEYRNSGAVVPYRIACVVVSKGASSASPGLLSRLGSDLSSALGLSTILPAAQSAIATAQAALPLGAVLTGGSKAFVALSGAVGTAGTAVGAASSLAGTQLASVAAAAPSGTTFGGAAGLNLASAAQDISAAASQAGAFVGRALRNLGG